MASSPVTMSSPPGLQTGSPQQGSKGTKAEQAAEPKSKAAKAKPAPQPGSAEYAAHWGEQVAPTGAVLVTKADSSASQGQGMPWPRGTKWVRDKPPKAQQQQ
ncbi:hypothetical protein HaLaN_16177 [Haematococcus lacustris]|uniref:Uncharacterized protein n=1 Tax=Haematococcus lacustris TaxID=44745 RepID=A0A699ZL45_HAELA|nr:hypothetical protein HaLaN_16177 [Haematococcus lacustris]